MTNTLTIDNRDKDEIIDMLEMRIEALMRRIIELESRPTPPTAEPVEWAVPC